VPSPHTDARTKKISGEKLQAETKDQHRAYRSRTRRENSNPRRKATKDDGRKRKEIGSRQGSPHLVARRWQQRGGGADSGGDLGARREIGARPGSAETEGGQPRCPGQDGKRTRKGSKRRTSRSSGEDVFYYHRVIISFWACACLFMWRYQNLFRFFFPL